MIRIFVESDDHILISGAVEPIIAREKFFRKMRPKFLVRNGDIIDTLCGDVENFNNPHIKRIIREMNTTHYELGLGYCFYVKGNHDTDFGRKIFTHIQYVNSLDLGPIRFEHGHMIDPRKIIWDLAKNRFFKWLFKLVANKYYVARFSQLNKESAKYKDAVLLYHIAWLKRLLNSQYQAIVVGHSHTPLVWALPYRERPNKWLIDCGDWVDSYSFAEIILDGGEVKEGRILSWKKNF